ncbi:hypothetical protein AK812_SmicGene28439 [Symbiodinium microadriaticum]|uniref:Uncharacterized protein n=1 Tax=Symbiodinium microadriaticum TaxID=2951 RepID=A0A1Q9D4H3_SYMMI|nr:hypothetical protein AK812_SmicGene28439 [Symbiodinium microadriaticum]
MLPSMKPHARVLILAACCAASWTFKLTESPIQLTDSKNETAKRMIEEVVSENMQRDMHDINGLPNPEGDNESESKAGFGELAKNLEFLLLKVAQLETVAEMHEAAIQEQAKVIQAQQQEINTLKGESQKDGAVLLEMEHKDAQTRLNEAQALAKRVMLKQTRQRQTRNFHEGLPADERDVEESGVNLAAESASSSEQESASWPWKHRRRRWNPVHIAKSVAETMADGYAAAKDKAKWVRENTINTVEKAVKVLTQGFSDFGASCPHSTLPRITSFTSHGLYIDFGKLSCKISLIGQSTPLFGFNFGSKSIALPSALKTAATIGGELTSCTTTGRSAMRCLSDKTTDVMSWDSVNTIGDWIINPSHGVPSLATVAKLGVELGSCMQQGFQLFRCISDKATGMMSWGSVKTIGGWILNPTHGMPSLATVAKLGGELASCTQTGPGIMSCLADKTTDVMSWGSVGKIGKWVIDPKDGVPPLSHLNRLGDILADVLEGFGKVAASVAGQVLSGGSSLIQEAVLSRFPAAGAAPVVHHSGSSLVITTHAQEHRPKMSALQMEEADGASPQIEGIGFKLHQEGGHYQSRLVTQFDGDERDTSSCLAFAPKSKHGANGQATEADWQVQNENDFVALDSWAVPCGSTWMKKNWDKWQGYSFYTAEAAIEKCVTVSFSISIQPVAAFVGGVQFELMPKPLASVDTTMCWPTGRPDGQDLSLLRLKIKSSGVPLLTRSIRLTKRYGEPSDFTEDHVHQSTSTWSQPSIPRKSLSRTKTQLLQEKAAQAQNQSNAQARQELLHWMEEEEDLYLASANYSQDLGVNLTSELRGTAAARRLSLTAAQSQGVFQLFNFEHPGDLMSFKLTALLNGNSLEMGAQMGFGPSKSAEKRFKLVDIAKQFAVVLHALPFVSQASRDKALEALKSFASKDLPTAGLDLRLHGL